jgi:cation diffusion facilitator family transporter
VTLHRRYELPPDKARVERRAVRLEYVSIAYLVTAIAVIYLALGSSQALKAAWVEDILALAPPIAFLVARRVRGRGPNDEFPYGHHRAVSIAYLCASLALFVLGAYILYDSVTKLIAFEHPPIGVVTIYGRPVWLGWLMLPALAYTGFPNVVLGRLKLRLAKELQDKVLYADAEMNKADWMTAGAAAVGVVGVGLGLWWADAVAASFISLSIVHDGWSNLHNAVESLMDARPTTVDHSRPDELPDRVHAELLRMDWVADARVRMREEGHVFIGEALVVPLGTDGMPDRIRKAVDRLLALDWRLHEIIISPVPRLDGSEE